MSNTPETDEAVKASNGQWSFVLKETCQRLERERDEWYYKAHANFDFTLEARAERDKAREDATNYYAKIGELERERDEAMEALSGRTVSCAACNHAAIERDEAREDLKITQEAWVKAKAERVKALRERDEAREERDHWKTEYEIVVARLCGKKHARDNGIFSEHEIIPKLTQERDEAREKAERYRLEANAMMLQRDEARSLVDHYREQKDLLPISWDV